MPRGRHRRGKTAVAPVVYSLALQTALLDHFSCSCASRDRDHCAATPTCPCVDVSLPGLGVTAVERRASGRFFVAATHGGSWPPRNPVVAGGRRSRNGVDPGDSG